MYALNFAKRKKNEKTPVNPIADAIVSVKSELTGRSSLVVFVPSLSHVQLFTTPWTAAPQASLSFTISMG